MSIAAPEGDLARCIVHERSDEWPTTIEISAYWKHQSGGKRGKKKTIRISADEFFGRTSGAPMTGDQLIGMIERMRKLG